MFSLFYRALTYFLNPSSLNRGERDQPAPLDVQKQHLLKELDRVRREQVNVAERRARLHDTDDAKTPEPTP